MNNLPGKFLEAIFGVISVLCCAAHAQVNCYDFSISLKLNIFSSSSASNKHKMFAKCQISGNFKIKVQSRCCDKHKVQQHSLKCVVDEWIVGATI